MKKDKLYAKTDTRETEEKTAVVHAITFTDDRPRTLLGPQGDHVSAYALFKNLVVARVEHLPLQDAIKVLLGIIDSYALNDTAQRIFDEVRDQLEAVGGEKASEIMQVLADYSIPDNVQQMIQAKFSELKRFQLANMLDALIARHLDLRNKLENTTFPREGSGIEPP